LRRALQLGVEAAALGGLLHAIDGAHVRRVHREVGDAVAIAQRLEQRPRCRADRGCEYAERAEQPVGNDRTRGAQPALDRGPDARQAGEVLDVRQRLGGGRVQLLIDACLFAMQPPPVDAERCDVQREERAGERSRQPPAGPLTGEALARNEFALQQVEGRRCRRL
jgi:hypothetical protein